MKNERILGNKALRGRWSPSHSRPGTLLARRPRLPTLPHHQAAEGRGTHSEQGRQLSTELTLRSLGQVFTSVSLSFLVGNLGVRTEPTVNVSSATGAVRRGRRRPSHTSHLNS